MKELELNISKVLIDLIRLDEFENIIYQEYYVNQITSNNFINKVITINYRNENWKKELEGLIYESWGSTKYLSYLIRKYCVKITETNNSDTIFNIVDKLAELNRKYDYEFKTLMQFYRFNDELDLILSGYGSFNEDNLMNQIKSYSQQYLNKYSLDIDFNILLNLKIDSNKIDKQTKKLITQNTSSNFLKKEKTDKTWFAFWKRRKRNNN